VIILNEFTWLNRSVGVAIQPPLLLDGYKKLQYGPPCWAVVSNSSSVAPPSWGRRENLVGETDIPQETVLGFQAPTRADISREHGLGSPASE